jgi:hypothetical protein
MSLSLETIQTSKPSAAARWAIAPMTSSASKPGELRERGRGGLEQLLDHRDLFDQFGRGFSAGGLVGGEGLSRKVGPFAFKDGGEVGRMILLAELPQHVVEDIRWPRWSTAAGGAHGRRAGPLPRVEGAEDQVEAVEQEQAGRHAS